MDTNHRVGTARKSFGMLLSIFLILTILASLLPQSPAAAVVCKYKHKVLEGETLIYIGNLYQVYWLNIAKANNIQPPYNVAPGTILCIPGGEDAGTAQTKKKKEPVLIVSSSMGHVLVSVENFSPKTTYYVRLYPSDRSLSYRIGHFTTNKDGDYTDWFKIPIWMHRTATMSVCVKNVWTDAVSCVGFADAVGNLIPYIFRKCGGKEGR